MLSLIKKKWIKKFSKKNNKGFLVINSIKFLFLFTISIYPIYALAQSSSDVNSILRKTAPIRQPSQEPKEEKAPEDSTFNSNKNSETEATKETKQEVPKSGLIKDEVQKKSSSEKQNTEEDKKEGQNSTKLSNSEMDKIGNDSTLLVIGVDTTKEKGLSFGSGFVISPTLILTNSHVSEGMNAFFVFPRNGKKLPAKVIANADWSTTGRDFAILELPEPLDIKPVIFTPNYSTLNPVFAFGYPIVVIQDDPNWIALVKGDERIVPNIVASSGAIQRISDNSNNIEVLMHSAKIHGGNSGGPLFDACGRVVGINTYTLKDRKPVVTSDGTPLSLTSDKEKSSPLMIEADAGYSLSLSSKEIIKFISSRSLQVSVDKSTCN